MRVDEPAFANRISALQSEISDLAAITDGYKARAALAAGAAVFLILLGVLGAYDLATGKAGIWLTVGFDEATVRRITLASGVMGLLMIVWVFLGKKRQREMESKLSNLEHQLGEMLAAIDPESS